MIIWWIICIAYRYSEDTVMVSLRSKNSFRSSSFFKHVFRLQTYSTALTEMWLWKQMKINEHKLYESLTRNSESSNWILWIKSVLQPPVVGRWFPRSTTCWIERNLQAWLRCSPQPQSMLSKGRASFHGEHPISFLPELPDVWIHNDPHIEYIG